MPLCCGEWPFMPPFYSSTVGQYSDLPVGQIGRHGPTSDIWLVSVQVLAKCLIPGGGRYNSNRSSARSSVG